MGASLSDTVSLFREAREMLGGREGEVSKDTLPLPAHQAVRQAGRQSVRQSGSQAVRQSLC